MRQKQVELSLAGLVAKAGTGAWAIAVAIAMAGCASMTPDEKFETLDAAERNSFLAGYARSGRAPSSESAQDPFHFSDYQGNASAYTVKRIEILATPGNESIQDGTPQDLKAVLVYADGRRADATLDVKWEIHPALAEIKVDRDDRPAPPRVSFGCVVSDLVISADFFGQAVGKKTLPVRKALNHLEMKSRNPSSMLEDGYLRMQLRAFCGDGSISDVTCLADWKAETPGMEVSGCGQLRLLSSGRNEDLRNRTVSVRAIYGGMEVRSRFNLPFRP